MRSVQRLDGHQVKLSVCPWCGCHPRRAAAGLQIVRDRKVIGLIGYANARNDAGHSPSGFAVVTVLWVDPEEVGEHVGSQLLQRLAWELRADGYRILMSPGTRGVPNCSRPPAEWLEGVGFTEHVTGLQWRLDLRRTVPAWRWLADAAAAARDHLYQWRHRPGNATRNVNYQIEAVESSSI